MRLDRALPTVGALLLTAVAVLLVLLSALPGAQPVLSDTISTDAYGRHGTIVFLVLLLFGLAAATLGASLSLRLRGAGGAWCGGLIGVWAAASVFDAFVRTSRVHTGTAFGQVHTLAAVAGIVAQLVASVLLLAVLHRRGLPLPGRLVATTAAVVAGEVFVAVHPDSLAGLCERLLFTASGLWMLAAVQAADARARSAPRARRAPAATARGGLRPLR